MLDPDIRGFRVDAVWDGAQRLLGEVGLRVTNPTVLRRVRAHAAVRGDRVLLPRDLLAHYAEGLRRAGGPPPTPGPIELYVGDVHCRYVDATTGETRPFDLASLAEHTRFLLQMRQEEAVSGWVPGYPSDVPPEMQFLAASYLSALYDPHPRSHCLAATTRAMRWNIEMSRILGTAHVFGVEPISPMSFTGGSIDACVALYEDGMVAGMDPMPMMGLTAPLDWHAAWAQCVAENVGSCVLLNLCGIATATPSFRLFTVDMATGMISFTSPLHLTALLTRRAVRSFFGLHTAESEMMHTAAKRPDAQAAAEKMAGCVAGAVYGFRYIGGAGQLDLDTTFSAQQLMVDLDIRDYVRQMVAALIAADVDPVGEVRAGIEAGSFLGSELTLRGFRGFSWRPRVFDHAGGGAPKEDLLARAARVTVTEKARQYTYELRDERREQVERLMARARRETSA